MWQAWRGHGTLPEPGGWLQQPLAIMIQIQAIELVYNTWQRRRSKEGLPFETATATEAAIIKALD